MVAIKINAFGGMVPAIDDRLLPNNAAADAANTWLYSGRLEGIRQPKAIHTCSLSSTKRVFRLPTTFTDRDHISDSYWMEFTDADTDVLKGPIANDSFERYYWTSPTTGPKLNSSNRIRSGYAPLDLGIPYPVSVPGVAHAGGSSTIAETRSYLFTWISQFGEESAPSAPAVAIGKIDDAWTITLTPPTTGQQTNQLLTTVRIYRTVTASTGSSVFYFVADVSTSTTTYTDTISNVTVSGNTQLPSTLWTPPPTNLRGMTAMPNGMIVGFRSNEIWFCEPYRPHAWPATYTLSVDFTIVGIGVIGQTAVICTQGSTYAVTGIHPSTMTVSKISTREPCMSRGSILSLPLGVVYASPNGLVLAAQGQIVVATDQLFTKDKWLSSLDVANLRAAQLGSAYYTFGLGSAAGGLIDSGSGNAGFHRLTSTTTVTNVFNDEWTNEVFIIQGNIVYQIDISESRPRSQYTWTSKRVQPLNKRNVTVMKVYFDNPEDLTDLGSVTVYADGRTVATHTLTTSGQVFRLPSGFKADFWQFSITSKAVVISFEIATSARELSSV